MRALATALVATFGLVFSFATAAHANPSSSDLLNQIDKEWRTLEPTIENYDLVHEQLQAQQVKAAALQQKIAPLALEVQVQLARVGTIAANIYMAGPNGTVTTLLNSNGSAEALDMLGEIEQMAYTQRAEVAGAVKLQKQYEAQAKPINALVASLQVQQAALNKQKAVIQVKIDALNAQQLKVGQTGSLRPVTCPQKYDGSPGARAARYACNQIGKPYIWDHSGPNSFDCSGLTMAAWATVGVTLPHNAYQQSKTLQRVSSFSQLKPGDLVFYYHPVSHVVIYVGNGWVVSAPQTGEDVQMKHYNSAPPNGYARP